ncbi:unnamed protein product [Schistosoma margrebowiei]|uniref:Uncharacterized protein n=1 Tax=Schistosoma margrebowiei TaxID=48269 RepID=A0A183LS31_9TREM|nr:unnamed protein product [Schistosoma margrebowiei]
MVVGVSQQETFGQCFVIHGTRQQGIPVILRKLLLPDKFDSVSLSLTVRDVTTELSRPRLRSCRTQIYLQLIDHHHLNSAKCTQCRVT